MTVDPLAGELGVGAVIVGDVLVGSLDPHAAQKSKQAAAEAANTDACLVNEIVLLQTEEGLPIRVRL